jgi:hypothetical protein
MGVWRGQARFLGEYAPLSLRHLSYSLVIAAPFHQNEQNNFNDNIRKGIANLAKHQPVAKDDVCRALMLRLSASASLPECEKWAHDYFRAWPNTCVELIILYQVLPTTNLQQGTTTITHYCVMVQGPGYARWRRGHSERGLAIRSLIGQVTARAPRLVMTQGKNIVSELPAHYMFQQATIYRYHEPQIGVNVEFSRPAPNVHINAVIGDLCLEPIAPPDPELLLLP